MLLTVTVEVDEHSHFGKNDPIWTTKTGELITLQNGKGSPIFTGKLVKMKLPASLANQAGSLDEFYKLGHYRPNKVIPKLIPAKAHYHDLRQAIEFGEQAIACIFQGKILGIRIFHDSMYFGAQLGPGKTNFRLTYYEEYADFMMDLRHHSRSKLVAERMLGLAKKLEPITFSHEDFLNGLGFTSGDLN